MKQSHKAFFIGSNMGQPFLSSLVLFHCLTEQLPHPGYFCFNRDNIADRTIKRQKVIESLKAIRLQFFKSDKGRYFLREIVNIVCAITCYLNLKTVS
jgi:hypothetical protein